MNETSEAALNHKAIAAPVQPFVTTPFDEKSETLSDFAWRVIDDVFTHGTEDQKAECVRSFYQRVDWKDEIEIAAISNGRFDGGVVLRKDGVEWRIESDDWKYRLDGRAIRDAQLADRIGVPVAFLDGVTLAAKFLADRVGTRHEQEKQIATWKNERKRTESAKRSLIKKQNENRDAIVRRFRREAEKMLGRKQFNTGIASAERKHIEELQRRCNSHDMPPVPIPSIKRSQLQKMEPFSGLYFEWEGLLCSYVGKSVNVPARVSDSHHKLEGDSLMSFLPMDAAVIGRNELFYIWLLNPSKNGGLD